MPTERVDSKGKYGKKYRHYTLDDGTAVPSVTTILDHTYPKGRALMIWAQNEERKLVKAAAVELYKAAIAVDDGRRGHELQGSGAHPMSVIGFTSLLDNYIGQQKASDKALEKASNIGNEVHAYAHWYSTPENVLRGPEPPLGPEATIAVGEFKQWCEKVQLKTHESEKGVYSNSFKFAGTLDHIGTVTIDDGQARDSEGAAIATPTKCIIDWKSASGIYPDMVLQVAAYSQAYQEMGKVQTEQILANANNIPVNVKHVVNTSPRLPGLIVKLPKKAGDTIRTRFIPEKEQRDNFVTFLWLRRLYDWIQQEEARAK